MKRTAPIDGVISGSPCSELLTKIRKSRKEWGDLEKAFEASAFKFPGADTYILDPFALLKALSKIPSSPMLAAHLDGAGITEVEAWARKAAQAARSNFDDDLRQLCARANVSVYGREPLYRVGGFLQVRLAVEKGMCLVGSKKIGTLLASRVWKEIQAQIEEEKSREVSPEQFLVWLHQAYRTAISRTNEPFGSSIPIKELFRTLAIMVSREKLPLLPKARARAQYTDEYFKRDLSKILSSGSLVTGEGLKMNLMPTSFAKEGVSVLFGEGIRIVGRVSFSETRQ
jgi:hypothetical protein